MVLGDLATQRATRRMGLPPLSEQAVRALAGREDADPAELYRVAGGNPFYLCEVLEAGWPCVPPTVRDMVGARMARLSPAAREAAQVAAVIGTRVGRPLLASVLPGPASVIDECLASGILVADGTGARFRHELVRMAAEEAISPHRKAELHERLLAALEAAGDVDPALLAHHAEGGGDKQAVRRYAPAAARRSSALGAHREAAAQFERALRFADEDDRPVLAGLYEALAGRVLARSTGSRKPNRHCVPPSRLRGASLGDHLAVGKDLSMLSGTQWQLCRGEESAQDAEEAVRILEALPPGPELAWAYVNVAISRWGMAQPDAAFAGLKQGRDLGERLGQTGVVSRVLTSQGAIQVDRDLDGTALMEQGLRIALDAGLQAEAGSAYTCLVDSSVSMQKLAEAQRYYTEGMAFCEQRELRFFTRCIRGSLADALLLLLGRWDEAADICDKLLAIPGVSPANQLYPLRILASIRGRRGDPGAWELADKGLALAEGIRDRGWVAQARALRAELYWLSGKPGPAAQEARAAYNQAAGQGTDSWRLGSLVIWLFRLGAWRCRSEPAGLRARPEPYAREMVDDRAAAAAAWQARLVQALRRRAGPARLRRRGPRCATRWPPSTPSAPAPPPPRPGGG